MPAAALDLAAGPVTRNALPFKARNKFTGDFVQILQQKCVPLAWRLLHRENLHRTVSDDQVVAMTIDRRVAHEIIEIRVVRQPSGLYDGRCIVHELSEEAERVCLGEPSGGEIADLHLEALRLVLQSTDCAIEFRFE